MVLNENLDNLISFLQVHDIKLYDEEYRILNALVNNKKKLLHNNTINQYGGGNSYQKFLGRNRIEILYNVKQILDINKN